MKIIRSIKQMADFSRCAFLHGRRIGFVPTMGALHDGHISLIREARRENDIVVVSIFINPAQFGPGEDFKKYPRNLKSDAMLCRREGAHVIFYPDAKEMYPAEYKTYVTVQGLSESLCGEYRPGHFKGVSTVVTKLFNIVCAHNAYFGQKDAQQVVILQRMVKDLNIPVRIKVIPTVREPDGLAMSSRNVYLTAQERKDAAVLYQALMAAGDLIKRGSRNSSFIVKKMRQLISRKKSVQIQYVSVVDLHTLKPVEKIKEKTLIVLAAWLGKTRLIDNIMV